MSEWSKRVLYTLILGVIMSSVLQAQVDQPPKNRAELERQRKKLQEDIQLFKKELDKNTKTQAITLDRFKTLQGMILAREKLLRTLAEEKQQVEASLQSTSGRIDALEGDLKYLKKEYAQLMRLAYRQKASRSNLLFLISARDFNEAVRRWQYLRQYDQYRVKQSRRIQSTLIELDLQKSELLDRQAEQERLILAEQHQKELWMLELSAKNRMLEALQEDEASLMEQLEESRKAHAELSEAIEAIIREEIARRRREERARQSKAKREEIAVDLTKSSGLSKAFAQNKGRLPWPVPSGTITSRFGKQPHPTLQNIEINNNGIDILCSAQTNVEAIFEGKVLATQFVPGHDYMLILDHGGYYSVYSNLMKLKVEKGAQVLQGQQLGTIRAHPTSGKTELHFEIWQEKQRQNPEIWIRPLQ